MIRVLYCNDIELIFRLCYFIDDSEENNGEDNKKTKRKNKFLDATMKSINDMETSVCSITLEDKSNDNSVIEENINIKSTNTNSSERKTKDQQLLSSLCLNIYSFATDFYIVNLIN